MSQMQTVESKDYTLDAIFNDYYVVPSYQRDDETPLLHACRAAPTY